MRKVRLSAIFKAATALVASPWRPLHAQYPALAPFDAGTLAGQSGVVALWHLGVRPRWLKVMGGADLAALVRAAQADVDIRNAEVHGGVYLAWAPLAAPATTGAVASLTLQLGLGKAVPPEGAAPFPLPPGTRVPAKIGASGEGV